MKPTPSSHSLATLFPFSPAFPPEQMSPVTLAYIGDAVHQLYIRQYLISLKQQKPHQLHRQSIRYVSAKAQANALKQWLPLLSEEEEAIVRRGRNAKSGRAPKNVDVLEYRHSTAFECLIGYLYCKHEYERLEMLLRSTLQLEKEDETWRK